MNATSGPIAVAAPHGAAVDAAREIVEAGGNAVDAAVAAAAVLTVVYPHMCSLGGDGIAILRRADDSVVCVNASGSYGSESTARQRLSETDSMPATGPLSVSVPGVVSGWNTLLALGGSLSVEALLTPAIRLARFGFEISPNLARALERDRVALRLDEGIRSTFFEAAGPLVRGEILVQEALAGTLEALVRDGLDSFYRGPTARRLADGLRALSVPVTLDDLHSHRPTTEVPLHEEFSPFSVITAGPNSQGYALLYSLGALLSRDPQGARIDAGILAEIFRAAAAHRDAHLADPRHARVDVAGVLTAGAHREAYDRAAARAIAAPRPPSAGAAKPTGDTVGVAVVCADGTAVSLIQSVFDSFGAQLLEPATGLVLHNRAASFSLDSRSPNLVQPGKRPSHTLVPVIVDYRDGAIAAHSTMGGRAQTQIHTQLLVRALAGMSAQETVSAPRFIVGALEAGDTDDQVMVEPSLEQDTVHAIARTALNVRRGEHLDDHAGHAMIARITADGTLDAGADPRSDGATYVGG